MINRARFHRKWDASGNPYFTLVAPNGEIVCTSESYSSVAARDKGIAAVRKYAMLAGTRDYQKPGP